MNFGRSIFKGNIVTVRHFRHFTCLGFEKDYATRSVK